MEQPVMLPGGGKDKFGSAGQQQVVLKEIDLPVVSNNECQDKLRSTRLGHKYKLHDSLISAGGVNLVHPSKYDTNTYVQTGMVARGIGCAKDETPGVYASVSKALCSVCLISMESIILTMDTPAMCVCTYLHKNID